MVRELTDRRPAKSRVVDHWGSGEDTRGQVGAGEPGTRRGREGGDGEERERDGGSGRGRMIGEGGWLLSWTGLTRERERVKRE
jgi:hypothetical protein